MLEYYKAWGHGKSGILREKAITLKSISLEWMETLDVFLDPDVVLHYTC